MNIKNKIITGAVLALTLFNVGAAQAKIPTNIDLALKPSLSSMSYSDSFYGLLTTDLENSKSKNSYQIDRLAGDEKASSPLGFQIFCLKNATECKINSRSVADSNFRSMRLIEKVNRDVNAYIAPRNDSNIDRWVLGAAIGDCEEYVLSKRSILAKSGIALGALRIATATTGQGVGHAVLIVRTEKGDYVLDNRTDVIKLVSRTDLTFHAISGSNPKKWTSVS